MIKRCKLFTDLSHFTAIKPREGDRHYRKRSPETIYAVLDDGSFVIAYVLDLVSGEIIQEGYDYGSREVRRTTRREEFNRLYNASYDVASDERVSWIAERMAGMFDDLVAAKAYATIRMESKLRCRQERATRFRRKAYLNPFTYYATFTYDDALFPDYPAFDKALRKWFNNNATRQGWKVMFVPEFGEENDRYHVHALIYIPKGASVPGTFREYKRFNKKRHKMFVANENTYCRARFGLNDWQYIGDMSRDEMKRSISYVVKYMTKTENRAYYSRGIPTFLLSDVYERDIIAPYGRLGQKVVLFDDFHVISKGVDLGVFDDKHIKIVGFS